MLKEEEAPPEAPVEEAAPVEEEIDPEAAAAAAQKAAAKAEYNRKIEKKRKMQHLLLAVLALLLLWMLTRRTSSPAQELVARRRAQRHSPVTPQELARAVFEVARDGNIDAYRGLFLNGGEAARVFGQDAAESYLQKRTSKLLEDALVNMAVQVPPNAVFVGVEEVSSGVYAMKLNVDARTTAVVPIGRAVQVGAIYRLSEVP